MRRKDNERRLIAQDMEKLLNGAHGLRGQLKAIHTKVSIKDSDETQSSPKYYGCTNLVSLAPSTTKCCII